MSLASAGGVSAVLALSHTKLSMKCLVWSQDAMFTASSCLQRLLRCFRRTLEPAEGTKKRKKKLPASTLSILLSVGGLARMGPWLWSSRWPKQRESDPEIQKPAHLCCSSAKSHATANRAFQGALLRTCQIVPEVQKNSTNNFVLEIAHFQSPEAISQQVGSFKAHYFD